MATTGTEVETGLVKGLGAMDAFDGYVLGRPKIDTVEVRFIPEVNTLSANILAGEVQLTIGLKNFSGEEAATVEEVCEPFLVRAGMIARTPRGRVATAAAWEHLGLVPPPDLVFGSIAVRSREPHPTLDLFGE